MYEKVVFLIDNMHVFLHDESHDDLVTDEQCISTTLPYTQYSVLLLAIQSFCSYVLWKVKLCVCNHLHFYEIIKYFVNLLFIYLFLTNIIHS